MPEKEKNKGRKRSCVRAGRIFSSLGLPADADCRMPVVTVTGGRYLKVEHHRGILLFTERCVRLFSVPGVIRIEGKDLASSSMDGDVLMLEGRIESVSFE